MVVHGRQDNAGKNSVVVGCGDSGSQEPEVAGGYSSSGQRSKTLCEVMAGRCSSVRERLPRVGGSLPSVSSAATLGKERKEKLRYLYNYSSFKYFKERSQ